ncbi:MAG: hypothetical protein M1371_01280 [Actinobacteria bacterium]|nr:hypothetical protein [Actinomycetota bacterium]
MLSSIARKGYDRLPVKHTGEPEIDTMIMEHFGVKTQLELLKIVGDDFRTVAPKYIGPELKSFRDGSVEGIWGERYKNISFGAGEYRESVYQPFKEVEDIDELDKFTWPSVDWHDFSTIEEQCEHFSEYCVVGGNCGMDLINGIAHCRGGYQVLIDIGLEDPIYLEIVRRRANYFFEYFKAILEAAKGKIDIIHLGEDLGTQNGILFSPDKYERIFKPYYKLVTDMVHDYGAKVMLHSCGSVRKLIPNIIETGIDILDVVQVTAAGMAIDGLKRDFGDKLCFCGSVCVQSTLPFGSVEDVRKEIEFRKKLFPDGGLIIGPTHAIQVGTPLENILEMYRCIGSLKE